MLTCRIFLLSVENCFALSFLVSPFVGDTVLDIFVDNGFDSVDAIVDSAAEIVDGIDASVDGVDCAVCGGWVNSVF